jgi:hypothetical protein
LFRGTHGYLALELWGKDKDLGGCVRPQFFTRSGEEIELPVGFDDVVKAVTSGVTCLDCSHQHYSRLVVTPPREEGTGEFSALRNGATSPEWKQSAECCDGIPTDAAPAVQ